MNEFEQIRAYRLRAHHLDQPLPPEGLEIAAGACGLQNSPPGAWETAAFNRLADCTLKGLQTALYEEKSVLQAWSYRGAPVVFPTDQSAVFLAALTARAGEEPWIYTRGITLALDHLQMSFDELLPLVKEAVRYLEHHTVKSKETLDRTLAEIVEAALPASKAALWREPSMYGAPDKQTVGGAVVSFLLRPCAFEALVVFGQRKGISPTFTSFSNWIGHAPIPMPAAEKELVRKFLRCYGPMTLQHFTDWLGASPRQAKRLWQNVSEELVPVLVQDKTCYLLASELANWQQAESPAERLLLLGAHDPYLDMRDRVVLLGDKALHRQVWQTVANPGVILKNGRIAGIWRTKTQKDKLNISLTAYEKLTALEQKQLADLAESYAVFRQQTIKSLTIEESISLA